MNRLACIVTLMIGSLGFLHTSPAPADVRLARIFSSDMVLQRDMAIPVWGWADAGEKITVKLGDKEASATAGDDGAWKVKLPALPLGEPLEMTITGKNTLKLTNILMGEVWVCSGQSNMEQGVNMSKDAKTEVPAANYPQIRLFMVTKKPSGTPWKDLNSGTWRICTPANLGAGGWNGFSAVAYYFGREIHKNVKVPVGLIESSWGGTRIEPWTPPAGFAAVPALKDLAAKVEKTNADYQKAAEGKPAGSVKHPFNHEQQPTGLYNSMIHPIVPFAIRGAIWYQGESNMTEGMLYHEKMKALIGGWRTVWDQGDFPFYFVQIAPFNGYGGDPTTLGRLWQAQLATLAVPNTGMAVTTDITTLNDIHPPNKTDVGKRLALWALAKTYGVKVLVYSGPLFKSAKPESGKITVEFDHTGSGLVSRDGKDLNHWEIAGDDKKFVPATAKIEGATVVVTSDKVDEPKFVRFAFHKIAQPNFMNKEGLPASPFTSE